MQNLSRSEEGKFVVEFERQCKLCGYFEPVKLEGTSIHALLDGLMQCPVCPNPGCAMASFVDDWAENAREAVVDGWNEREWAQMRQELMEASYVPYDAWFIFLQMVGEQYEHELGLERESEIASNTFMFG